MQITRKKKFKKKNNTKMWLETIGVLTGILALTGVLYVVKTKLFPESRDKGEASAQHSWQTASARLPNNDFLIGIDLSHYQGEVEWNRVLEIAPEIPISYIILRATMGHNGVDRHFENYWMQVKWKKKPRGAYHYFRPNEDGYRQAQNYIANADLKSGDLFPIVDIEKEPRKKKIKDLRRELLVFLNTLEAHYKVTPILYTMDSFYQSYLSTGEFEKYPLWIANYNLTQIPKTQHWIIWQFSEKGIVKGIKGSTDLNLFRGNEAQLKKYLIP